MFVRITPLDTVFVRDSRSFGVNEAHAVDSLYPPPPSVIFGAMRGALLMNGKYKVCAWRGKKTEGDDWPEWFLCRDEENCLIQQGPVMAVNNTPLFPLPLDTFINENDCTLNLYDLEPAEPDMFCLTTPCVLKTDYDAVLKISTQYFVTAQVLKAYLDLENSRGGSIPLEFRGQRRNIFMASELWQNERRTNVSIDPELYSGREGALFSLEHVRTDSHSGVSLISRWHGTKEAAKAIKRFVGKDRNQLINLGGERRPAKVRAMSDFEWPMSDLPELSGTHVYFRIYFATPAYFNGGWKSVSVPNAETDEHGFTARIKQIMRIGKSSSESGRAGNCLNLQTGKESLAAHILAAAVGKYQAYGGYDIELQREKPMRRFVPAGSVYYLKAPGRYADDIAGLNGKTIGDDLFLRMQGYGLVFVGRLVTG
ncbi:MAG: hypothetical protein GY795_51245 [Desulfobacterales bacterium]|nr:hypothetical protein [Desulfobacterales bacterium]